MTELARIEIPEPRHGGCAVEIVFEFNDQEYHVPIVVLTDEPVVSVVVKRMD